MKFTPFLIGLFSFSAWATTPVAHPIDNNLTALEYKLKNGLTVILTENPKAPNVTVAHWVKAGSLHEKPGTTGIAHLFEHMMFRPLKKGAPDFDDLTAKFGAKSNANTRFESTYYFTSVAPEHLNGLLKVEADRFRNLVVTDELLDLERKAVWSEYSTKFDANPMIDLWFQIYVQGYKNHPLGWMIVGYREDLEKIKASDCNAFFKKHYTPNNVGLFVTGNFKAADAIKQIKKFYGDWKQGETSVLPEWSKAGGAVVGEGNLSSKAKNVLFGIRTPYMTKENIAVQSLVNDIIVASSLSLLNKRLVDSKQIASSATGFNFDYDNAMIKALVSPLPGVSFAKIQSEIKKIKTDFKNLSDTDFETYKKNFYISASEDLLSSSGLEMQLALAWGKYGDLSFVHKLKQGPLAVSKKEAQAFLDQYFTDDNLIFLTHKGQMK